MARTTFLLAFLGCVIATIGSQSGSAAIVNLQLQGTPNEFITQGNTYDLTYDTAGGSTIRIDTFSPITGLPSQVLFTVQSPVNVGGLAAASVRFETTNLNSPLAVGVYPNAAAAPGPPAGSPGVDVTFDSRGARSSGQFEITEIQFGTGGSLERFAANFQLASPANPSPRPYSGSITFSAAATAIPEPGSLAALGMVGAAWFVRRRRWQKTVAAPRKISAL